MYRKETRMQNFWDFDAWGTVNLVAVLLLGLLVANILKKNIKLLQQAMIPTSVLAGLLLFALSNVWSLFGGVQLFETDFFSNRGLSGTYILEIITFHALALGFIAQTLVESPRAFTKKRANEIFNTGVTTVSTYLLQGILGMGVTIIAALTFMPDLLEASGLLLPFGYGQGTGQALNYGSIYEAEHGFVGGKTFGLTIAALGFLSASIGGVVHLNILRHRGYKFREGTESLTPTEAIENENEIPMNGAIDKLTVQVTLIAVAYLLTYGVMYGLGLLLPGMKAVIYGFNFLFGVLMALAVKAVLKLLKKRGITKKQYTNNFLLTHLSNLFFDIMIVAGIAAIRISVIKDYWIILLILAVIGILFTYLYNYYVSKKLFGEYKEEQFLAMYGMLTGTASTGVMLLRELDPKYETPVSDNLVYQNLPAIIFGFPLMLLATLAPVKPYLTWFILLGFFIVMNVILWREKLFKRFAKKKKPTDSTDK